jgi:hypothetical protein
MRDSMRHFIEQMRRYITLNNDLLGMLQIVHCIKEEVEIRQKVSAIEL